MVDIAENKDVDAGSYSPATDPQLIASAKAQRGPLSVGWFQVPRCSPHPTSYPPIHRSPTPLPRTEATDSPVLLAASLRRATAHPFLLHHAGPPRAASRAPHRRAALHAPHRASTPMGAATARTGRALSALHPPTSRAPASVPGV